MYATEYSWTRSATNVTRPSMVTDSRSTVTPQVMLVSPMASHWMLKKASPLLSKSANTYQNSTKPSAMAAIDTKAPLPGRNLPTMATMKKAEALRAGITHAQSAPMVSAKGICVYRLAGYIVASLEG